MVYYSYLDGFVTVLPLEAIQDIYLLVKYLKN